MDMVNSDSHSPQVLQISNIINTFPVLFMVRLLFWHIIASSL
ncbi:unnamed protein product [Prunus armeniaca]|uniref:Uncharacterized protein n=1 Tax=Prunus armeniaca TaxID=36596 RepID=A0A6J5TWN8_PRUAR|nr:unnamed protein product [Prunus armeniaca]